ncbi:MAG: hypothetical protein ACE5LB_08420, partial [Acidiferrobacterales bacterium]
MKSEAKSPFVTLMAAALTGVLMLWAASAGHQTTLAGGKELNIAMVLWRGETEAELGFKEGLQELGYSVRYTILNAGQDRAAL